MVLPFWYRLSWVVPEKGPLNGCVCVIKTFYSIHQRRLIRVKTHQNRCQFRPRLRPGPRWQWRRQAWGMMGHVPPPLEFDARKISQPFFVSTYRPITHIKALIAVTVAGCCKKTLVIFVFADMTPDGFHFWMTLSPRPSEAVRHAPVPGWNKILATPLLAGRAVTLPQT